jgi:hypothetical protein
MKKKIFKILKWSGIIIMIILIIIVFVSRSNHRTDIRIKCSDVALNFVKKKSENKMIYSSEERDSDYKFTYNYCFQQKGLEPEL